MWPRGPLRARQLHVRALNLLPGILFLDVQIEADQRKCQSDRLRAIVRILGSERIDHMLVNERGIAEAERVGAELVVRRELYFIQLRTRSAIFSGVNPR